MKIKTHELEGVALDWAVAVADGRTIEYDTVSYWVADERGHGVIGWQHRGGYSPSTKGGDGHPIIEREGIQLRPVRKPGHAYDGLWLAMPCSSDTSEAVRWFEFRFNDPNQRRFWRGETALIAAMRCFVHSKLGAEVDVPSALKREVRR